jgi:hypothetical protein
VLNVVHMNTKIDKNRPTYGRINGNINPKGSGSSHVDPGLKRNCSLLKTDSTDVWLGRLAPLTHLSRQIDGEGSRSEF